MEQHFVRGSRMTRVSCAGLLLCSLVWVPAFGQDVSTPEDAYERAKALADAAEAKLPAAGQAALAREQARVLGGALAACLTSTAETLDANVVLELDVDGSVTRSWRNSGKPIALCLEGHLRRARIIGPWRNLRYTSFEVAIGG